MNTKKYKSQVILESFEASTFLHGDLRDKVLAVLRQHHRETLVRARVHARWLRNRKKDRPANATKRRGK